MSESDDMSQAEQEIAQDLDERMDADPQEDQADDGVALQSIAHPMNPARAENISPQEAALERRLEETVGRAREAENVGPRRVDLVHSNSGYSIWMGDRQVQGFCNEFESVTGYILPQNSRQQVRITIEPLGEVREPLSRHNENGPVAVAEPDIDREIPITAEFAARLEELEHRVRYLDGNQGVAAYAGEAMGPRRAGRVNEHWADQAIRALSALIEARTNPY